MRLVGGGSAFFVRPHHARHTFHTIGFDWSVAGSNGFWDSLLRFIAASLDSERFRSCRLACAIHWLHRHRLSCSTICPLVAPFSLALVAYSESPPLAGVEDARPHFCIHLHYHQRLRCVVFSWIMDQGREDMTMWPNQSPEPTAVGACSSAIAVRVASRRWLSFFR